MKINRLYWSDELVGFSNFLYKKYNVAFPPILVGIGSRKFCYLLKPKKERKKRKKKKKVVVPNKARFLEPWWTRR